MTARRRRAKTQSIIKGEPQRNKGSVQLENKSHAGGDPALDPFGDANLHGGDVWSASRRLAVPVEEILDLSASLNPLGPPSGLREALEGALEVICHYPDRHNTELVEAMAGQLGLEPGNILPGNGSTALIRLLGRALDLSCIQVVAPAFGEFSRALAIAGRHFHYYILPENRDFVIEPRDMDSLWRDNPTCLIITNPMTPSGGLHGLDFMDWLLGQAERRQCWVVLDEAFIDFAPRESREWVLGKLNQNRKLLVLRSMTKFYCLAGLRLGYMMGHPDTLAELAPLGEPWSVNTLASAAGVHCLAQREYAEKTRELIRKWREEMAARLEKMGLYVFPSQVNYLLTRLPEPGPDAAAVAAACARQGVLLRDCSNFSGCTRRNLRLAVTTSEEQERLFRVLEPALKG